MNGSVICIEGIQLLLPPRVTYYSWIASAYNQDRPTEERVDWEAFNRAMPLSKMLRSKSRTRSRAKYPRSVRRALNIKDDRRGWVYVFTPTTFAGRGCNVAYASRPFLYTHMSRMSNARKLTKHSGARVMRTTDKMFKVCPIATGIMTSPRIVVKPLNRMKSRWEPSREPFVFGRNFY